MIASLRHRADTAVGADAAYGRSGTSPTRAAYAYGLVMYAAHAASFIPRLANVVTQTPVLRDVFKAVAGLPSGVRIPPSASQTFKAWFSGRETCETTAPAVVLFADTFTNYFHPDRGIAAVATLERAGYRVIVPQGTLCCGGPLYRCGKIPLATTLGREVLEALRPHLAAGAPVIGLDSRCVNALRDALAEYVADPAMDQLRDRLRLLSDFLTMERQNGP